MRRLPVRSRCSTSSPSNPKGPRLRDHSRLRALQGLAVGLILLVTLWPSPMGTSSGVCLWCGDARLADSARNVLLFVPLGAALGLGGWAAAAAIAASAALSLVIEIAQLALAGRQSSVADVLFNAGGAAFGFAMAAAVREGLRGSRAGSRARAALAGGAVALALVATGALLTPVLPTTIYHVQWTPDLAHLGRYEGRVVAASLGELPLRPGRSEKSRPIGAGLEARAPLELTFVAGPPPASISPILSIFDEDSREILLVGAADEDLVLRLRMRAAAAGLEQPVLRLEGALVDVERGQLVRLRLEREARGVVVRIGSTERHHPGHSLGAGWRLLVDASDLAAPRARWLDAMWLALMFLPLGLLARSPARALASLGPPAAAMGLLAATSLPAGPSGPDVLVAALAALSGWALGTWWERRRGTAVRKRAKEKATAS